MWDDALLEAYRRKFYNRDAKYMRDAVIDSIRNLLGICDVNVTPAGTVIINDLKEPPAASYEIYLTSQRVTFGYYRIDENAFVVPLDMKKSQDPAPRMGDAARSCATNLRSILGGVPGHYLGGDKCLQVLTSQLPTCVSSIRRRLDHASVTMS